MRGIADTIARLNQAAAHAGVTAQAAATRLRPLTGFGANPGALNGHVHIPENLPEKAPLVVVLHGCTQTAAGYDAASGWSRLADEQGFALLYPEQQRANNPNGCFNWFETGDTQRGSGEAASIHQMIVTVAERHAIDLRRIFITGLSAGGAMTATMLATYPEVFAGGAIIAGLPHGVARDMMQALDRMRGHNLPDAKALSALVRDASDHHGRWPTVSIWHGGGDTTVSPANADAILSQWLGVHGLNARPSRTEHIGDVPHRLWCGTDGQVLVEDHIVPGMAHGAPLKTAEPGGYGAPAPFMLEAGISSTLRIAASWGIATPETARAAQPATRLSSRVEPLRARRFEPNSGATGIGKIIEDALRATGLMR